MQACPGCGLSLDDAADFCATCGWRSPAEARDAAGEARSLGGAHVQPIERSRPPAGRLATLAESLWSAPKRLVAVPLIAVVLAAHVAFPHLPWSRYAVRFGNTYDTTSLRFLAGLGVLLAGVGLWVLIAWLLRRGR